MTSDKNIKSITLKQLVTTDAMEDFIRNVFYKGANPSVSKEITYQSLYNALNGTEDTSDKKNKVSIFKDSLTVSPTNNNDNASSNMIPTEKAIENLFKLIVNRSGAAPRFNYEMILNSLYKVLNKGEEPGKQIDYTDILASESDFITN